MKIGKSPNISETNCFAPVKKPEAKYSFGNRQIPADSFVRENKPKTNFFSNFFSAIKNFFVSQKAQNPNRPIDISTIHTQDSGVSFKGISVSQTKAQLTKQFGLSEKEISDYLKNIKEKSTLDDICALMELHNITPDEVGKEYNRQKALLDGDIECSLMQTIENIKMRIIISEEPLFAPFKLSLEETEEITSGIIRADSAKIEEVLKKNNREIGEIIERENLVSRYQNILYQKMALDNFNDINPDNLIDLGIINGRSKKIIFPNATGVESAPEVDIDVKTLIKSNIITMELLNETKDVPLPKTKTANAVTKQKITLYPEKIREKALKFGIDSLTTYEIHALTDCFSDMPEAKKATEKIIKNKSNPTNKQLRKICGYKNHLKKLAAPILKDSNVKIDDHAYLRMLDRNMVSIADNSKNKLLSFPELIEVIKTAAEEEMKKTSPKNEILLPNYQNGSGLKILVKYENGTCTIDSVM